MQTSIAKMFQIQKPMLRVCFALIPTLIMAIYLFGWRSLFLTLIIFLFGISTEAIFTLRQGKPVTSAVFVTCMIFSLSLPPTIPVFIAIIGIVFGVMFGKMVFGGFGQNVFNPAMVGRCFIYIAFPMAMTNSWVEPFLNSSGGFSTWTTPVDAITSATPLAANSSDTVPSLLELFIGNVSGSMGETSALLIILGGLYIIYKKAAPWRIASSCLIGGILVGLLTGWNGQFSLSSLLYTLFSGAFMFGCAFVATEPISGAKTHTGQWIYGFIIGGLTMILRKYSNFTEGVMFSVILMNAFVPLIDYIVRRGWKSGKVAQ